MTVLPIILSVSLSVAKRVEYSVSAGARISGARKGNMASYDDWEWLSIFEGTCYE